MTGWAKVEAPDFPQTSEVPPPDFRSLTPQTSEVLKTSEVFKLGSLTSPVLQRLWFNQGVLDKLNLFFENECTGLNLDPILVGVSGGPDSLCLLDLLIKAQKNIIVAHFNHQLRPESDLEAGHVQDLAQRYALPFVSASQDVNAYAASHRLSLEEAARKLRYRFLFAQAREHGAPVIAVAHHADDQVETVLMHFLRGAGLSGLKGMSAVTRLPEFDSGIFLIRPLLRTWREQIEAYCRMHQLETVEDLSNMDQTYFRNRLRHSLIPEMETYNPGFKQALLRSAESLGGDHQLVRDVLDGFWMHALAQTGEGYLAFEMTALREASPAMLRNLFRQTAAHLNSDLRDVNFDAVERMVRFVRDGGGTLRKVDFTNGNHAFVEEDKLFISRRSAKIPLPDWPQIHQPARLAMGKPVRLGEDWQLSVNEISDFKSPAAITANADPFQAWMDADLIHKDLHVRNRLAGDRFQPLGMPQGSIKLSDFFINEKLPSRGRTHWPLICQADEIIWVPGYRLAHPYRVTDATRRCLHFQLSKTKSNK